MFYIFYCIRLHHRHQTASEPTTSTETYHHKEEDIIILLFLRNFFALCQDDSCFPFFFVLLVWRKEYGVVDFDIRYYISFNFTMQTQTVVIGLGLVRESSYLDMDGFIIKKINQQQLSIYFRSVCLLVS